MGLNLLSQLLNKDRIFKNKTKQNLKTQQVRAGDNSLASVNQVLKGTCQIASPSKVC